MLRRSWGCSTIYPDGNGIGRFGALSHACLLQLHRTRSINSQPQPEPGSADTSGPS